MKYTLLLLGLVAFNASIGHAQTKKNTKRNASAQKQIVPKKLGVGMLAPKLNPLEWFSEIPDTKDKFIALDFWGPTCKPCIGGFGHVNELQEKYKDNIIFIAVTTDSPEPIYAYDGPPINFSSVLIKSFDTYSVDGIPHMIITDPRGLVVFSGNGHDVNTTMLDKFIHDYKK